MESIDEELLLKAYRGRGVKPHQPKKMLALSLYCTLSGCGSPNRWARMARESLPLRELIEGLEPSARACYRFRDRMSAVIHEVNQRLIQDCLNQGIIAPVTRVVQDGTTQRSAGSRHQRFNQKRLTRRKEQLQAVIAAEERGEPLPADAPKCLPNTPSGRLEVLDRIEKAEKILHERLEENASRPKNNQLDPKRVTVSLSDPEAAMGRDKENVFGPIYNTQCLCDCNTSLIVAYCTEAQQSDVGTLLPMLDAGQAVLGHTIKYVGTDKTYCTILELKGCEERHIELLADVPDNAFGKKKHGAEAERREEIRNQFIWDEDLQTYHCPAGHLLTFQYNETCPRAGGRSLSARRFHCAPEHCLSCDLASLCAKNPASGRTIKRLDGQELLDKQRERMKQDDAKEMARHRNSIAELTFGDIKQHRNGRRMHGRGLTRARTEVGILVLARNIMILNRLRQNAASPDCEST